MQTKRWERIALCVLAVLCVVLAVVALRPDPRPVPPNPPADVQPAEPSPPPTGSAEQTDGAEQSDPPEQTDGAESQSQPPADTAGQSVQANAPAPVSPPAPEKAPAATASQSGGDGLLSTEEAQDAALAHAGLTAGEVTFTQQKLEWEDGRQVYDVEFYTSAAEYDYEIDAATGEVLQFDRDAESFTPPVPAEPAGDSITREKAQEIALAQVPGAAAEHVKKLELEWEDGIQVYEAEIVYNQTEYEMDIRAADGSILKLESEPVHD